MNAAQQPAPAFWSTPAPALLERLQTAPEGLSLNEARRRLRQSGALPLRSHPRRRALGLLLAQFCSPIVLILLFAAGLSFFLHQRVDALIILSIVLLSGWLGFRQEYSAADAVQKLLALVQVRAVARRDGQPVEVPAETIVPGDVVILAAGSQIPGDGLILESKDLYVDEATLTGESYPVEKVAGVLPSETPLNRRGNSLFRGTHVVSGTAIMVVAHTGATTEFGRVSQRLQLRPEETEFERGVRRFGHLLLEVTLLLILGIFAVNVYLHHPVLDSFLFSLALAVGLTPQLLPAIISINLAHGAQRMAREKVIVKRLASIENFGSMDVLCSDKTGTLTEGEMRVQAALDVEGHDSDRVLLQAYLNATFENGFTNPIDEAIRTHRTFDVAAYHKMDEVPYDFIRKRLSVLVAGPEGQMLITKGAPANVLEVCTSAQTCGGVVDLAAARAQIERRLEDFNRQGRRTLGVAYRTFAPSETAARLIKEHESNLTFSGFIVLADPPKSGIAATIAELRALGVTLKIITGDNRLVAAHLAQQVGLDHVDVLTGPELHRLSDAALRQRVESIEVFAEVEPNQKERILHALRKAGHVVGYIGDGINDASALHAADVGISVASAVDVAKEAADIVLLEKDLGVLVQGVREGRITFANTLKYVFMATSANFGNMFSMAGASLFLPFLPLLPKQILLTNLLTDFPEMTIAGDSVDGEMVEKPRRWDIAFICRFMLIFGALSSVFDFCTFGALLFLLRAGSAEFRTGWFVESVISASMIVLVIRTRRPFFASRPSPPLIGATLVIAVLTLLLPFTVLGKVFGFVSLPFSFLLVLGIILTLYVMAAEITKRFFYGEKFYGEKKRVEKAETSLD
jgi:Mg2+-importing ATPase